MTLPSHSVLGLEEAKRSVKKSKNEKKPGEIKSWIEMQVKPIRRLFPRNPYTVNKLLDG